MKTITRCQWCGTDPLYQHYHDTEWGVPSYDDTHLFEMINLEGAQAGLSWITILKKRDNYRRAFDQFNAEKMACYNDKKIQALLQNPGIVRNKLKVNAAVHNARCYLKLLESHNSLSDFLWQFVDGQPIINSWKTETALPVTTPESDAMSRALKKHGFKFIGSTTCYAFMQAVGMVNDHTTDCFRYRQTGG